MKRRKPWESTHTPKKKDLPLVYFDVERKIYVENPTTGHLYTGRVIRRPPPVLKPLCYSMASSDEAFDSGDRVTLEDMKRILYRELYGTVTGRFTGRDIGAYYYDEVLEARPKGNRAPMKVFPKEGSLMGTYIGPDNFLKGRMAIVRFPLHGAFGTTPTCKCLAQFDNEQVHGWHEHLLIHFQLEDDSHDN